MRGVMAAAALGLAACTGAPAPAEAPVVGCAASVEQSWAPAGGAAYRLGAHAQGARCADAVLTLVVADAEGKPLYASAHLAQFLFGFEEVSSPEAMQTALRDWLDPSRQPYVSTAELPDWPEGAAGPSGEFPLSPEAWLDRAGYQALRAKAAPVFCHVQGRESLACLALEGEQVEQFALQSFPG